MNGSAERKTVCTTMNGSCKLKRRVSLKGTQAIRSEDIKPGNYLFLRQGQRVPADCLLLYTSDPDGVSFAKTDQLDGETDWKVREAVRSTHKLISRHERAKRDSERPSGSRRLNSFDVSSRSIKHKLHLTESKEELIKGMPDFKSIMSSNWRLRVAPPNDRLYEFSGVYTDNFGQVEPLKIQNLLLAHMTVASCDVFVQAVYVGRETKMAMNSKRPVDKFGRTDQDMNDEFKVVFIACSVAAVVMFLISGAWQFKHWAIELLRIFLLMSSTLPFMLKLNADIAKIFYSYSIQNDQSIPGTIVRNRQIPEELGRVEFLLCDKTGTLTRNEMIFKQLVTLDETYGPADGELIDEEVGKYYGLINEEVGREVGSEFGTIEASRPENGFKTQLDMSPRRTLSKGREQLIKSLQAMLLCNNVSPTVGGNERQLQASSPDEISLVEFAESFGFEILSRKLEQIEVKTPSGEQIVYRILQNFPFSSDRKRMGIILRNQTTQEIDFYVKGADSIMQRFLDEKAQIHVSEKSNLLSSQGLRTLVLAMKRLTDAEYSQFRAKMIEAQSDLTRRADLEEQVITSLEHGLTFLCVTGVEDLLQDKVKTTVASIREAGISVWLLTGDKLETAKCVAISTGFKNYNQRFHEILDSDVEKIQRRLREFNPINCLVVSGDCLEVILHNYSLATMFFENAMSARSVVLCRCAPKQKAEVALALKNRYKKIVAAIGDGGNDVGMIQSASVGIGVEGREGMQASLASDYSITQFQHVIYLFLWHGRMSFVRSSKLAGLVIHRGFLFVTIQYLFMCVFSFITIRIYNSYLTMLYGTLFTNLIVFSVIFDTDIPKHQTLNYPSLYRLVQHGQDSSPRAMLIWKLQAVYQGAVIILFSLAFFPNLHADTHTITFTALIFVEYLNVYTVIANWSKPMSLTLTVSILCYLACLFPFRHYCDLVPMDRTTFAKIMLLVIVAWLPMQILYLVQELCFPNPVQKLVQEASIQEHRKRLLAILKFKKSNI